MPGTAFQVEGLT